MYGMEFNTFERTALYYAFRRLTQSVTPGSVGRLTNVSPSGNTGSGIIGDDVYAAGFKRSDGKQCLVVVNSSKTVTYNGTLKINELSSAGWKGFNTYYTSSDGNGPINDVSLDNRIQQRASDSDAISTCRLHFRSKVELH